LNRCALSNYKLMLLLAMPHLPDEQGNLHSVHCNLL
jgi:hypothetical protein